MAQKIESESAEFDKMKAAFDAQEKRRAAARKAARKHAEKRREEGITRTTVEVSLSSLKKHREAGHVIVGVVWCPKAEYEAYKTENKCVFTDMVRESGGWKVHNIQ